MRRMAPATQAAERRTTNSKPSLETKVTYSEGWEAIVEVEMGVACGWVLRYSVVGRRDILYANELIDKAT